MNDWPYGTDADEHDELTTRWRIPVTSSHPCRMFLISFDRMSEMRPTVREASMLNLYLEHKLSSYGLAAQEAMRRFPLDSTPGCNTVTFHKWASDDWGFRRSTFVESPLFYPGNPRDTRRPCSFSLLGLLDYLESVRGTPSSTWVHHKQAYHDVINTVDGM